MNTLNTLLSLIIIPGLLAVVVQVVRELRTAWGTPTERRERRDEARNLDAEPDELRAWDRVTGASRR